MSVIRRLDNDLWSYMPLHELQDHIQEIRLHMPESIRRETRYTLIQIIVQLFNERIGEITKDFLKKGFVFKITAGSSTEGLWHVSENVDTFFIKRYFLAIQHRLQQYIPFFRTVESPGIIEMYVEKNAGCLAADVGERIAGIQVQAISHPREYALTDIAPIALPKNWKQTSSFKLFDDPFTRLATKVFQQFEDPYVMERAIAGTYQFALTEENQLTLIPIQQTLDFKEKNKYVLREFIQYLTSEFDTHVVEQLQVSYGIDFAKMLEYGEPLLPDHVARCNIGVNDIEIADVEQLWRKLLRCHPFLMKLDPKLPIVEVWERFSEEPSGAIVFPGCVRRKIEEVSSTCGSFQNFMQWLIMEGKVASVHDLSLERSSRVVRLLVSSKKQLERAFTGRKIEHLAITGFRTMGDPNGENPARDFFELLHIFSEFRQKNSWENFFELLAHVYCKKNIFRKNVDYRRIKNHVGLIIPGPILPGEGETYFFTKALLDDGRGCFSYTLEAVSRKVQDKRIEMLPWIKVYRSTNSNSNSPHWYDSVLADLNPYGSPGEGSLDVDFPYERREFDRRTIPLWVAHLVKAMKARENRWNDMYITEIQVASSLMEAYLSKIAPAKKVQSMLRLQEYAARQDWDGFCNVLIDVANDLQELPQYKCRQNLYFIGHSLGGSLAQMHMWYGIVHEGRLPLPDCNVCCFDYNGPAIGAQKADEFLQFGRANVELLRDLKVRFFVKHQFEYGDFVPEGGQVHLGASHDRVNDAQWLDFNAYVFKPTPTANALSMRTLPTHGRRIESATVGKDYTIELLSQHMLYTFDQSWFLEGKLRKIFGYRFLVSPKISELFRRVVGAFVYYPMILLRPFIDQKLPGADENGVVQIVSGHELHNSASRGVFVKL